MTHKLNQVKERPINLSADEVIAVKEGYKTQIRVPIKHTPATDILFNDKYYDWRYDGTTHSDEEGVESDPRGEHYMEELAPPDSAYHYHGFTENYESIGHCPLGKVGDRLWVREKHRPNCYPEYLYPLDYEDLSNNYLFKICDELEAKGCPKASDGDKNCQYDEVFDGDAVDRIMPWRSPIAMPRWASRLLLEIVDVRVERLQDISDADAIAEGCIEYGPFGEYRGSRRERKDSMQYKAYDTPQRAYQCVWNSKHGKQIPWAANPWVWVIKFKAVEGV